MHVVSTVMLSMGSLLSACLHMQVSLPHINLTASACADAGQPKAVRALMQQARAAGLRTGQFLWSALVSAHISAGQANE